MSELRERLEAIVLRAQNGFENKKESAELILRAIEESLPKEKESPNGKDCKCAAHSYAECGCYADWSDNRPWNDAINQIKSSLREG